MISKGDLNRIGAGLTIAYESKAEVYEKARNVILTFHSDDGLFTKKQSNRRSEIFRIRHLALFLSDTAK